MNKTAIKNFAIWARNKLIADISYRAGLMGITANGIHATLPQSTGQTEFYDIGTAEPYAITGEAIRQRRHLVELIQRKEKDTDYKTAYKYIIEEVAYTWFNRLIAVRFMEINDYLPSRIRVLSSDTGKLEPDLVTTPFDAELSFTRDEEQLIFQLKQENKIDELFRILFIRQCNALNEILPALFEKTSDYTELLLNLSVIDQDGVVYHLVHDVPEEDFDVEHGGQVEIIGWLYQYYNTEPKNEAFAKKGKITKEEVPAVTQLFTPDWIVRYMVENSLGRLWVEGHPNDALKAGWKYYLEEAEQEPEVQEQLAEVRAEYTRLNPEDIRIIDPCMGSGHILVYAFDVLMQIYESAGYGQRDAARSILENNLYGLDIDDRALQIAYFAVMMKARQYNRRILNGKYKPNLYSIQESNAINSNQLQYFGTSLNELEKNNAITQMTGLLDTFKDAKEYGSILTVEPYDWDLLERFVSGIEVIGQMSIDTVGLDDTSEELKQLIAQGKVLAQKYHVTITNPPYMAVSKGSEVISNYIKSNYPESRTDLFAVFIEKCKALLLPHGYQSMITMHAWMFLSSFEQFRNRLSGIEIVNLAHLGPRGFEEIAGEVVQTVAFIFRNIKNDNYQGIYHRLVNEENQNTKENAFLLQRHKFFSCWNEFHKIPGSPIVYWAGEEVLNAFKESSLNEAGHIAQGLITGDTKKFTRLWYEINIHKFCDDAIDSQDALKKKAKWVPYNKGGEYRKWYGNNDYVVNWESDGYEIKHYFDNDGKLRSRPQGSDYYFKDVITWTKISTSKISFRHKPAGHISSEAGMTIQMPNELKGYVLGFCNSSVAQEILHMLSPTLNYELGDVGKLPLIVDVDHKDSIDELVTIAEKIVKDDWDSREISWDFTSHSLVKISKTKSLVEAYEEWKEISQERIRTLEATESEINRLFAEIYGLSDQVKTKVDYENLSIQRASLKGDVKGLLSYAVGCMFGRYSLDSEGIAYAGGIWNEDKYIKFQPDADNIIPITDEEYLEDDIVTRLCSWLKIVYGEQTLEENLDFIAKALVNKGDSSREIIRNYFLNDFFKDHCQTYSVTGSGKRPIYWLFDSGKQNGFKALIYLHRYNADSIGNLRVDYLHRMQRVYESEISRMQDMIDHSTNAREVGQATKRIDKLTKQLKECREYDEKLAHLALSRIELDLDDGVKVNYRKLQTANDGKFYEVLADSKNIMAKE